MPFNTHWKKEDLKRVREAAAHCGMSANQYIVQAVLTAMNMADDVTRIREVQCKCGQTFDLLSPELHLHRCAQ